MSKVFIYIAFLLSFVCGSYAVISNHKNNIENGFVGVWQEVDWEYKVANNFLLKGFLGSEVNNAEHHEKIRNHKGDKWIFQPDGKLVIESNDSTTLLSWHIKGRGNVLEITDGILTDHFDIRANNGGQMELNYISDIQVKESATLTFKQIRKV